MIYGKLPVVFLGVVASEKSGSTNSAIASYILEHIDEVKDLGIKEMAGKCHVGTGSISRFCKDIGLRDFAELRELLRSGDENFEPYSPEGTPRERLEEYGTKVNHSISMAAGTLSVRKLGELCRDLRTYEKVALFGLLKAECAAVNLQGDLWLMGRNAYTNVSYEQQISYISQAGKDTLILIFSYTGAYFEYHREKLFGGRDRKDRPKIWMISGKQESLSEYVAEVLDFQSLQDQTSHPWQLLYAAGVIAREYGRGLSLGRGGGRRKIGGAAPL